MYYSVGLYLIFTNKNRFLLFLIILGALNRDASVFLIFMFLLAKFDELPKKNLISLGIIYLAVFALIELSLRLSFPGAPHAGRGFLASILKYTVENLTHIRHLLLPLIVLNVMWFISFYKFKDKPKFIRRVMSVVPFFMFVTWILGRMIEVRIFIPVIPIIVLSSVYTLSKEGFFEGKT